MESRAIPDGDGGAFPLVGPDNVAGRWARIHRPQSDGSRQRLYRDGLRRERPDVWHHCRTAAHRPHWGPRESVGAALQSITRDARSHLSLIHISEPTRQAEISYAVFCLKKKKKTTLIKKKQKKKKTTN